MKNSLNFLMVGLTGWLILFVCACAQQHYVVAKGNSLSLFYTDSNAKEILFASSIDHYQPHPAKKVKKDVWEVTVPLTKEFDYFYLVDGIMALPECTYTVHDDFGAKNCLYVHGL